jgi:serine/threonine-protein kinase
MHVAAPDALRQIADKVTAAEPVKNRQQTADAIAAQLALYAGDLAAAERSLLARRKDEESETIEARHGADAELMALYDEEGAPDKAAAVADEYMRRMPAWSHEGIARGRAWALATLRRAGKVSREEAAAKREAWLAEWRPLASARFFNQVWFVLYAYPARSVADASDALAALPSFSPMPPGAVFELDGGSAGARHRALAAVHGLAGDADRAIPELREAIAWCGEVGNVDLVGTLRSRLLLGQMLEQKADRAGACEQYVAILKRWGDARPRSVTAEKARARSKALACPGG